MSRTVRLSEDAFSDIEEMRAWNRQFGSGRVGRHRVQTVLSAIERLRDTPCLHRRDDRFGARVMTIDRYVVVYEIEPDTGSNRTAGDVFVIRVFGPGQQQTRG